MPPLPQILNNVASVSISLIAFVLKISRLQIAAHVSVRFAAGCSVISWRQAAGSWPASRCHRPPLHRL